MAATHPSALALSVPERQVLEAWLAAFDQAWHGGALAERVQALSALSPALHFPALVEMVKRDLARQWQHGHRVSLLKYLEAYPQLGSPYTVPADLILAEYEARRGAGEAPDLIEFARAYPGRLDELRRLLDQARETTSLAAEEPRQATPPPEPSVRPRPAAGGLPEQFGRYRIIRKLGQGGMGTVYLAHDAQFDRPVALKVPHFSPDDGPEVVERFYREARAAAVLHHPNFCPVYDVGAIDGTPYLTMAYLEGRSLAEIVREGPLPPEQAAAVTRTLAAALAKAHERGVIHRDLKPSNVLLTDGGDPVILDFGLARRIGRGDVRLTQSGALVGTPAYVAPEQLSGKGEATPSCDIYSLGALFYELLTGRPPFLGALDAVLAQVLLDEPPPPSSLRPQIGRHLDAVCLKALAKKPAERYASMTDFAAALTERREVVTLPHDSTLAMPAPPPLPSRRRPWLWALTGAAAILLAVGASVVWYVKTNEGTVQVLVDIPDAEVEIDGVKYNDERRGVSLPVGEHTAVVYYRRVPLEKKSFLVRRGQREVVQFELARSDPATEMIKSFTNFSGGMMNLVNKASAEHGAGLEEMQKNLKDFGKIPP
jgi:predicted Ser/Thr protein kinase